MSELIGVRDKIRAQSARNHPTRSLGKPASGSLRKNRQIGQILTNHQGIRDPSPREGRPARNQGLQKTVIEEFTRGHQKQIATTTRPRQELFEENMKLKKQLNKLREELAILKGKVQVRSKRGSERSKQLDLEFQKPLYWTGNHAHVISGIKHQYDKLKKECDLKNKEIQKLKIALMDSKGPQDLIYTEQVAIENRRLVDKLQKYHKANLEIQPESQSKVNKYLLLESKSRYERLKNKNQEVETSLKNITKQLEEKNAKIQFLEKLVIQKDNREYHAGLRTKKNIRMREQVEKKYQKLKEQTEELHKIFDNKLNKVNNKWENQLKQMENNLLKEIQAKEKKIKYMEEDQRKTEDAFNRMRMSMSGINQSTSSILKVPLQSPNKGSLINRKISGDGFKIKQTLSQNFDEVEQQDISQSGLYSQQPKERVMQRADKKYSENSKKCRKVQFSQIQEIGELIRLRGISARLDIPALKALFTHRKQQKFQGPVQVQASIPFPSSDSASDQQDWDDEYICMGEVLEILTAHPISLQQNQASLVARYMIEDCDEEYVYSDLGNENKRQVVKSIFKTIVGDFELPNQSTLAECQDFMQKYGNNIGSILDTYYPNGKVTKKRLVDILGGVGANLSDRAKQQLCARLAPLSTSLDALEYRQIFPLDR